MKPISIQIKDFGPHADSTINFDDFNCALIVGKIRGNERGSNGSGKSTLFSAIRFVLFNQTDYSSLDNIIRKNTNKCMVSFDFVSSFDNHIYRIVRSRHIKTGSDVRLFRKENEELVDLTQRTNSQTEQEIQKIIKINYKTFCNSAFFGQMDLTGLASSTPSARKKILKEILDLSIYSKYEKLASKKTSDLLKEIDKTKTILSTIGSPENDIKQFSDELTELSALTINKNNSLLILKEKHDIENNKYLSSIKELEVIEKDIKEYILKYKFLENEATKSFNIVKEYDKKIFSIKNTSSSLLKEMKDIKIDISKIDLSALRAKDIIKQDIENVSKQLIENKASINYFNSKLIELKIPLPSGGQCKHCRRVITEDEVKSCQEAINQEIKEYTNKIKLLQDNVSSINGQDKKLKEELQQLENITILLANKKQQLENKEKEIDTKKSVFIEFSDLLEKSKVEYDNKKKELDLLKSNKPQDNSEMISNLKLEILNTKNKISSITQEIEIINKEIVSISNKSAILNHKIDQRKLDIEKIKEHKENILILEKKHVVHSKVVLAFGSRGIPALITQTILDDFMYETNQFISKLHPGIQLQFIIEKERTDGDKDDTLDIQFLMNNDTFEYEALSGAQKLIVALALRLGLASVLTKRLGVSMQMLLIDEVDQCLDDINVELFEEAIKKISQSVKVLVITHNKELKAKFNHVIVVEQDENFVSTARIVNDW
jgi:DNA repair exonuclease SbcCD ATPase subunit